MGYKEEEYLDLSGIQHFSFCRRQWALIHVEGQWAENLRTVEGHLLHGRAHDAALTEKRGDLLITRALPVTSHTLGATGICDVVEFHQSPEGAALFGRAGKWLPIPVEYKRGSPKENDADRLQLCAQAICLEEMLCCKVEEAYLYYGETAHRNKIELTEELRNQVAKLFEEMHGYARRQYTPKVKPSKSCNACSLKERCMPKLCSNISVANYIDGYLKGE